jgi:hypothetical protein
MSSELGSIFKSYNLFGKNADRTTKAFFALAAYNEKVEIEDGRILKEIRESDEERNDEYGSNEEVKRNKVSVEKEISTGNDSYIREASRKRLQGSARDASKGRTTTESSVSMVDKLRNMVSAQTRVLENISVNSYNPYESMSLDAYDIQNSVTSLEGNLNKKMEERDILETKEVLNEDYNDLVGEQAVISIGIATSYPGEDKLKSRESNEKIINSIIDKILIDDVE